jgi:uncharacterized protein with HEPN domain
MPRQVEVILDEIIAALDGVDAAVKGHDAASFARIWLLQRGVERALEIVSEAVRHLPQTMLDTRPDIAWADIRAIGNLIRHEYHRVEPAVIWSVVNDDLPALRHAIEAMRAKL